ncbi:hypothetical protein DV36_00605 [Amycolatopsis mediterranei]|uniref:Uncharacterized protein n=1 Tax=Amycolatopsis mediterranei (strain S699) TaxID=713604 RepID=A0A9R0UCM6_AMYMS|nr:hypothetical protein RAM_37465 [Amycolatopsis mediterranei S699]KDU93872.1 hypothetical protein DV36_00605 [Amycolatopsis mediterranei]
MRRGTVSQVPDARRRQRDEVKAGLHRFTEIRPDVTQRVRQRLKWIVRPDRQRTQRKMPRPCQYELSPSHVQVRLRQLTVHGGFSSHERQDW